MGEVCSCGVWIVKDLWFCGVEGVSRRAPRQYLECASVRRSHSKLGKSLVVFISRLTKTRTVMKEPENFIELEN